MAVVPDERRATLGEADDAATRHRHRRRRVVAVAGVVAALVLGLLAYALVSYALREHPGAKSVGSAVHSFHGSGSIVAGGAGQDMPAVGVYTLAGQGSEHISFPPNSQQDGAAMPATVRALPDSCWRWHVDYNVAHWEEFDFCPSATGLLERYDRIWQSWDFGVSKVTNLATITCPPGTVVLPANPVAGSTISWSCLEANSSAVAGNGRSTTAARILGTETLSIGGHAIAAVHELQRTTVTGRQTGSATENWWLDPSTGLPLRIDRTITVHTDSPIGTITYTENGSWRLSSLTPRA
jgi:hypothetical protein